MSTKVLYVRVPASVHDEITEVARVTGVSLTDVVRILLCVALGVDDPKIHLVATAKEHFVRAVPDTP